MLATLQSSIEQLHPQVCYGASSRKHHFFWQAGNCIWHRFLLKTSSLWCVWVGMGQGKARELWKKRFSVCEESYIFFVCLKCYTCNFCCKVSLFQYVCVKYAQMHLVLAAWIIATPPPPLHLMHMHALIMPTSAFCLFSWDLPPKTLAHIVTTDSIICMR